MSTPENCPYDAAMVDRRQAQTADHSIRIALLEQAMKNITDELHAINSNIGKLIWIAVAAIGASAIQFILKGGLA
jgi:hypothetical protein